MFWVEKLVYLKHAWGRSKMRFAQACTLPAARNRDPNSFSEKYYLQI